MPIAIILIKMIRYDLEFIKSEGYQSEDVYSVTDHKEGVYIGYEFGTSENKGNAVFVVKTIVRQLRISDDKIIHEIKCESKFTLYGTKDDFINTNFDFFEGLLIRGFSHLQGIFSIAIKVNDFNFSLASEQDFKHLKEELLGKKDRFIIFHFK